MIRVGFAAMKIPLGRSQGVSAAGSPDPNLGSDTDVGDHGMAGPAGSRFTERSADGVSEA